MQFVMRPLPRVVATLALALFCAASPPASAGQLTVLPPQFATTPGGFQGVSPLGFSGNGSRTQNVYESELFGTGPGPMSITGIDLRAFPGFPPSFLFSNSVTVSNITIRLSTTGRGDEGNTLSATFADNIGDDATTVFSGALTLTTAATGLTPVNPFDYSITFDTPFRYDPSAGNLLIDAMIPVDGRVTPGSGFGFLNFDTVNLLNDGVYSVFNGGNGNATSGTLGTSGPIIQIRSVALNETAEVPEPATLGMVAASLLGFGWLRRRQSATA
jgi:hypothetical protein